MCGIIGFVDKKNTLSKKEKTDVLGKMLREIRYRGYDSSGIYIDRNVCIGHNRLAILDTSPAAKQPFISTDKSTVVSYNGEIFNHVELRNLNSTYKYLTHSDTETLVAIYEKINDKIFELIRGMFAVSIYNVNKREITLSIDTFGIKPLYYIDSPDWFAWSSEAKTFKHLPGLIFNLNKDKLSEYGIFRTTTGSETIFDGIYKVNPSETLKYNVENDNLNKTGYSSGKHSEKEHSIESLLKISIKEHLLSDVPVGFQLSGGIDSSLISSLAAEEIAQSNIHSFSIGLNDPLWNEFPYSRKVADLIGTTHHEIEFTHEDFCKNLPLATYHLDEPLSYPNTVAIMLLSKEASKYVKVLLSGEGADEIFGGYIRYQRLLKDNLSDREIVFSNSFCSEDEFSEIFFTNNINIGRLNMVNKTAGQSPTKRLEKYDLKTFLPSLLLRQDKMGMAHTLENRFPFLDIRLVTEAMNMSDQQKCTRDQNKIYLKNIASKYLPAEIVNRKKCGFGLPISSWLHDDDGLGKYLKLFKGGRKRDYLNYLNIERYIAEHRSFKKDNSEVLWILVSLEVWARIFIDGQDYADIWESLSDKI